MDLDAFIALESKPVKPGVCAICGGTQGEILWYAFALGLLAALTGICYDGDHAHRECVKKANESL
jgi:hypothetical protein